ncbi:pyridoxamine 5'-phosphate oxidase family protein [Wukongibacter baidiensis]|uniref:pyridoxamine 5'-phosphate oxidase family protein n=1 Tax=Wukongibacter baidiensis TaxID=1723361 RepID=UPI003D7F73D1
MNDKLLKKAAKLMSEAETATLSSIDENGYPRAVEMSNAKTESLNVIYFSTGTDSRKVKHYKTNPKAGVSYNNGISLIGEIEIVEDEEIKKELWQDWYIKHFPKGVTDPNYCVLRFTSKEAVIYIDEVFTTISLPYEL